MKHKSNGSLFFMFGMIIGAGLAILYTPKTGQQTRDLIKKSLEENEDNINKTKETAEELIIKTKSQIEKLINNVSDSINEKIQQSKWEEQD